MAVPYTFGTATAAIPLSQLDSNFATAITIGNTAVQLGNTVTTLNNMTLANVTISSGTITITNVAVTTANVSGTANISTLVVVGNETVGGNTTITGNITAANANVTTNLVLSGGTANGVAYLNTSKQVTTGSALTFDGTTLTIGSGNSSMKVGADGANNFQIYNGALTPDGTNFALEQNYLGTNTVLNAASGGQLLFRLGGSNNAVLTSTGLGIGTSSPGAKLDVSGLNAGSVLASRILNTSTSASSDAQQFIYVNGATAGDAYTTWTVGGVTSWSGGVRNSDSDNWYLSPGGNLGTSPAIVVTTSGNLLVGTTSTGNAHILQTATRGVYSTQFISSTASSPYGININFSGAAPNGTGNEFLYCNDSSALRMQVRSNGGIANYSANNVNLSDRREKTNFAPATSYLDKICAIPVQTFNYIDQNIEDDAGLTLGVVAQDVQAVAPELVMESNWGTEEEPKMRLSIYQTDLQYALMKALQELKAEFDAYKASHP
jgi:hypothetical protein